MSIKHRLLAVALAAGAMVGTHASTIYQFDSSNYLYDDGDYTTSMHLTWVLTLDDPLLAGVTNYDVFALAGASVVVNDGVAKYAVDGYQTLNLTTDTSGHITGWDYSFSGMSGNYSASGNNLHGTGYADAMNWSSYRGGFVATGQGTWSYSGPLLAAAPAAPVPEPETYALMLAGLAVLGFVGKRGARRSSPAVAMA